MWKSVQEIRENPYRYVPEDLTHIIGGHAPLLIQQSGTTIGDRSRSRSIFNPENTRTIADLRTLIASNLQHGSPYWSDDGSIHFYSRPPDTVESMKTVLHPTGDRRFPYDMRTSHPYSGPIPPQGLIPITPPQASAPRPRQEPDEDGFTIVTKAKKGHAKGGSVSSLSSDQLYSYLMSSLQNLKRPKNDALILKNMVEKVRMSHRRNQKKD